MHKGKSSSHVCRNSYSAIRTYQYLCFSCQLEQHEDPLAESLEEIIVNKSLFKQPQPLMYHNVKHTNTRLLAEQCYDDQISQKENTTCSNWDAEPGSSLLNTFRGVRGRIFLIHKLLPYKGAPLSKNTKKELEGINKRMRYVVVDFRFQVSDFAPLLGSKGRTSAIGFAGRLRFFDFGKR